MQRSLKPWSKEHSVCFLQWCSHQGRTEAVSLSSFEEMGQVSVSGALHVLSFVARTLLSHLRVDGYIHCGHPSHTFKIGQAVYVWWINHGQLAIGSLKDLNPWNLVISRTANNKSIVTCGLTYLWSLLFLICKQKIWVYPNLALDSRTFSLSFSLFTLNLERDREREEREERINSFVDVRRHYEVLIEELHKTFPK